MTDDERQERLEELAVRAGAAAAMLQEVERAEEAEGLDADQLEVIEDKRALAEHELADVAAETSRRRSITSDRRNRCATS